MPRRPTESCASHDWTITPYAVVIESATTDNQATDESSAVPKPQLPTALGPIDVPARALVVVAHPDDIDFGSAGTVALLTSLGSHVAYCLVTSGEAGDDDMTVSAQDLAALRQTEQTAAGAEVGVSSIHWLGYPDGQVECNLDLRRDISRVIRIERPDLVITQSPTRNLESMYGSHPDHTETAEATLRAVYPDARNPRAFQAELLDQGHAPHAVSAVWIGSLEPDICIDITDVFDRKIAALRSHESQVGHRENLDEMMRDWGRRQGEQGGLPQGRLAESFRALDTR